jgi:hypothetical protein
MSESALQWLALAGLAAWFYFHGESCKDRIERIMEKIGKLEGKGKE